MYLKYVIKFDIINFINFSYSFPKEYPNNTECLWDIQTFNGYHIGLSFVERFNLETSDNCENDYVQVSFKKANSNINLLKINILRNKYMPLNNFHFS